MMCYVGSSILLNSHYPVVEAIGSEAKSKFTGHIPKVTIEIRPMAAADKAAADKAGKDAVKKKALAD